MSFNNVAIVYVKECAYRINFWYMCKDDAINILNGSNLFDKMGALSNFFIINERFNLLSKKQRRYTN